MSTVANLAARTLRKLRITSIAQVDTPAVSGSVVGVAPIAVRALQYLTVVDGAEVPEAEDQLLAEQKVSSVHQMLLSTNKVPWASTAIPEGAAQPYAILTAFMLAHDYGAQKVSGPSGEEYALALAQLTNVVELGSRAQSLAEQKVRQVHNDLTVTGKARWTVFDIPDYVDEGYIMMAAYYLGPEFDKPVDRSVYEEGKKIVLRAIALDADGSPTYATYY